MDSFTGTVVIGDGRGQALGFPTANLELHDASARPEEGVYAGWARLRDHTYMAAIHAGPIPTYGIEEPTVEVHLLQFPDTDLYGEELEVQIVHKLRDIENFGSTKDLKEALGHDVAHVAEKLQPSGPLQTDD